jgi:hypothetical protein
MKRLLLLSFLIFQIFATVSANSFYVSSAALATGTGSFNAPWQFQIALNHPSALKPGDTVWLKGGIYKNNFDAQTSFSCKTNGTANAPIIFRNYNNERAIIDGNNTYSLYASLGTCSYTWFWGIEVTNTLTTSRNVTIGGAVTCTAENMKFINMKVHDTGSGLDCWKTAKNSETYGCIIYNIGNNLNNNGNWEGHGHGMYLQNDTFGTKLIHNNIVFSTYGYGIKIWQTTTTAPLGNFDVQRNIVFNGGAASENLGGVGNNSRTHNFFVVANGVNNPVVNSVFKHNYTYSGLNIPRPPVNAFGLNYGVKNMVLDSNVLVCQLRLGLNNTPVFDASVKGNKIIGGIPAVYGVPLWGFLQTDYPINSYSADLPTNGLDYYVIPNKYEPNRAHLAIYNWDSADVVQINIASLGFIKGDILKLTNAMDMDSDTVNLTYDGSGKINVNMKTHTAVKANASNQTPASQFPKFGAFILQKTGFNSNTGNNSYLFPSYWKISPNPNNGAFTISNASNLQNVNIYNALGQKVYSILNENVSPQIDVNISTMPNGMYTLQIESNGKWHTTKIILNK